MAGYPVYQNCFLQTADCSFSTKFLLDLISVFCIKTLTFILFSLKIKAKAKKYLSFSTLEKHSNNLRSVFCTIVGSSLVLFGSTQTCVLCKFSPSLVQQLFPLPEQNDRVQIPIDCTIKAGINHRFQ